MKKTLFIGLAIALIVTPLAVGSFLVLGQTNTTSDEIDQLNRQIRQKREQAEALQEKQKSYEEALRQKQTEKMDLNSQIAILENHIAKTQIELDSIKIEIDQTDLEIRKTALEIMDKEETIDKEKEHIGSVIRLLYKHSQASSLEILLLNNSFSEFINQVKYLGDVNGELTESLRNLNNLKEELEKDKIGLETKKSDLAALKKKFDDKLVALQVERESQDIILSQLTESEEEYQKLIKQSKQEQAQASNDIVSIEKLMRIKMAEKDNITLSDNGLVWPVKKNVITSTFHDPGYPFRYIFEHPAIDIRAAQGSTLRAAASGYVARAKDAGMGYSYIMIVHADGLATVYGHVSKIMVKEDDFVTQGQTIGLSGATPGTPGAGKLTTGAHLHFEVRLNGIPVNPESYLP